MLLCSPPGLFQPTCWLRATQTGPWQYLAFCCHGAGAVSVVWATCAAAHGSLINVMFWRNRSGEQEVLAKKKTDGAPLVLRMPFCIKSVFPATLSYCPTLTCSFLQKKNHFFPPFITIQGKEKTLPALRRCVTFFHATPSPGHCHVPGPSEQRALNRRDSTCLLD